MESMTGYGSGEAVKGPLKISVESRSVNGRHLDIKMRIPQELNAYETDIRKMVGERFSRGTVFLNINVRGAGGKKPVLDTEAARRLAGSLRLVRKDLGLSGEVDLDILTRFPQVLQAPSDKVDPEALWNKTRPVLNRTLAAHKTSRRREGAALKGVIREHLSDLTSLVSSIRRGSAGAARTLRDNLKERIIKLTGEGHLDRRRLEEEVALLVSRRDFTEEMNRLKAHLSTFRKVAGKTGPVGRNLEFLVQEINRELNTIAAKAPGEETSRLSVAARVELEKIKEQVYNVE